MNKYFLGFAVLCSLFVSLSVYADKMTKEQAQMLIEKGKTWGVSLNLFGRELLPKDRYEILWEHDTERPFTGALLNNKRKGTYITAGCRIPVFSSEHKFDSGTGWPSFWDLVDKGNIVLKDDYSWFGIKRIEVLSACGEHLGHVFDDGPKPTGLRYCINSKALLFIPDEESSETP